MTATAQRPERPPPHEYVGEEMSLVEHLTELRSRLFKSVLAVMAGFAVGFIFREQVLALLTGPYCQLPENLRGTSQLGLEGGEGCTLVTLDVMSPIVLALKTSGLVAVVVAGPVVCYQLLRFVTPGLRPIERRYSIPFIVASQVLFLAGAVFSYFIIPRALEFLLGFLGPNIVSVMDANRYLSFVLRTMIAFGISFEFPLVLMLLTLMGIVTAQGLRGARRYALFGIFAAAAVITPTQDPFTMTVMAVPLIIFYEVSIIFAWWIERGRRREQEHATLPG